MLTMWDLTTSNIKELLGLSKFRNNPDKDEDKKIKMVKYSRTESIYMYFWDKIKYITKKEFYGTV